jgi:hypothetical protein
MPRFILFSFIRRCLLSSPITVSQFYRWAEIGDISPHGPYYKGSGKGVSASERTNERTTCIIHRLFLPSAASLLRCFAASPVHSYGDLFIHLILHVREIYCGLDCIFIYQISRHTCLPSLLIHLRLSLLYATSSLASPVHSYGGHAPVHSFPFYSSVLITLTYYRLAVLSVGRNRSHNHL